MNIQNKGEISVYVQRKGSFILYKVREKGQFLSYKIRDKGSLFGFGNSHDIHMNIEVTPPGLQTVCEFTNNAENAEISFLSS